MDPHEGQSRHGSLATADQVERTGVYREIAEINIVTILEQSSKLKDLAKKKPAV
jgi:hypothetical protein